VFEVPINYFDCTHAEGKKTNSQEGLLAMLAIARFGLSDASFRANEHEF
jgi:hypothetical protein